MGGPTFNAGLLTRYLGPEYETLLVAGMKDESEAESDFILEDLGIKATKINNMHRSLHPIKDLKALLALIKIIREFKPDIIHTHASKAGFLGRLAGWICRVDVMVHTFHGHVFHSYFSKFKTNIFLFLERFLAKRSNAIIAISPIQKKELVGEFRICSEEKMQIVPLGFDLEKFAFGIEEKRGAFRKAYGIPDDAVVISIIGRLVPIKNHDLFFESIVKLKENTQKRIIAFVVGDGESKSELIAKSKSLGLDTVEYYNEERLADVIFTSWIKTIDIVNAGSDVIALSSHNEGTPVSLIEAQAAGKPIVSTEVGGIADVVEDGKGGFLVPAGDVTAFSDALLKLVEDQKLQEQMKNNAQASVLERFSYQRLVKDIDLLYRAQFDNIRG